MDLDLGKLPNGEPGLQVWPVATEPRAVCLPVGHRLANREAVTIADLVAETVLDAHTRRTSSVEEKLELVASGAGIAVLPVSTVVHYGRADVISRPAPEHDGVPVALVVSERPIPGHVRAFVDLALREFSDQGSRNDRGPRRPGEVDVPEAGEEHDAAPRHRALPRGSSRAPQTHCLLGVSPSAGGDSPRRG